MSEFADLAGRVAYLESVKNGYRDHAHQLAAFVSREGLGDAFAAFLVSERVKLDELVASAHRAAGAK